MIRTVIKYLFITLAVVLFFHICSRYISHKYADCFQREYLAEGDEIGKIIWSSPNSQAVLRGMSSPAPFATDVPATWLALFVNHKNTGEELIYDWYASGYDLQIDGDSCFSFENWNSGNPRGFAGWYKRKNNHFISISDSSTRLVYYKDNIYHRLSEKNLSVVKKVYNIGTPYNELAMQKDYKEKGLFKLTNGKLEKVSEDAKQVASMKDGLFYVPRPGSNTKFCFNLLRLVKRIEDGYPKRICPEYGL